MKKKRFIKYLVILIVALVLAWYPTGYYCVFPGEALNLSDVVKGGRYQPEDSFHMTTVTMIRANLPVLLYGYVNASARVAPEEDVLPQGWKVDEYNQYTKYQMQNSHNNAKEASAKWLNIPISEIPGRVRTLRIIDGQASDGILESQDIIMAVNGFEVNSVSKAVEQLSQYSPGQTIELQIERNSEVKVVSLVLGAHPEDSSRAFIGVTLINDERLVEYAGDNKITIETGRISGPSAGLMLTLEIINKMTEIDLASGQKIAGTGTIDASGKVGTIGGINQKLIAARRQGMEIFFIPQDNVDDIIIDEEKYEGMKLVPVETLEDALNYLYDNQRVAEILPVAV